MLVKKILSSTNAENSGKQCSDNQASLEKQKASVVDYQGKSGNNSMMAYMIGEHHDMIMLL